MNFDFSSNLFFNSSFLQFTLVKNLQRTHEPVGSFPCEIYTSKLPFTKRFSDFEHTQMIALGLRLLIYGRV